MNEMPGGEIVPDAATIHAAVIAVCEKLGIDPAKPMDERAHAEFSAEFERAIYASATLAGERERNAASFEFLAPREPWRGVPVVNGHRILTAESVHVDIPPGEMATVTLRLIAPDALKVVLGDAKLHVHDETRIALISMGWTPPPDGGS